MCVCLRLCVHSVCVCACVCVYMCMCVCVYMCMCMCVCVTPAHTHTRHIHTYQRSKGHVPNANRADQSQRGFEDFSNTFCVALVALCKVASCLLHWSQPIHICIS